jgi:predicted HAD superfamily Cof-like phosphohydrolase
MRALAAAIALSFLTIAALAASPEVEAALKAFQTAGTDANRLKTFCELMQTDQQNEKGADPILEAKMGKLLDELGADFKAAWETAEDIDPASDDGKVLNAALDQLSDKCPR